MKLKTITLELKNGKDFDINVPEYNSSIKDTLSMYILPDNTQIYYDCLTEKFYADLNIDKNLDILNKEIKEENQFNNIQKKINVEKFDDEN